MPSGDHCAVWGCDRKGCLSIDFIVNHTETYTFHAPTLATYVSHKITAKMRYSLPKITAFNEETILCHTFSSSDLQRLPPGDSRILCA